MPSSNPAVRRRASLLAIGLLALFASSCADEIGPPPPGFISPDGQSSLGAQYRLGAGDKLKINVFGEESLSGPVEVSPSGLVTLPLAGEVPAQGSTVAQFRDAVTRRLADGYLKQPKVTVEIITFRPIYIHGEVRNGGEFPFKTGLRLRDAIAMAGGYTYRANQSFVLVAREGAGETRVSTAGSVTLLPGDNIRIPERFF